MDLSELVGVVRGGAAGLVRTSFSDDAAWARVRDGALAPWNYLDSGDPDDEYEPNLEVVDDARYDGLTAEALTAAVGTETFSFVFLADAEGMADPTDPTVVVLSFGDSGYSTHGQTMRTVVSEVPAIESNLSLANMDFDEFAESAGPDGVFRGFAG